jgi:hypothetical protein
VSHRDTGIYDDGLNAPFGRLFTITQEGDQLFAQMPGQSKLPIDPEREHALRVESCAGAGSHESPHSALAPFLRRQHET